MPNPQKSSNKLNPLLEQIIILSKKGFGVHFVGSGAGLEISLSKEVNDQWLCGRRIVSFESVEASRIPNQVLVMINLAHIQNDIEKGMINA